jgi:peroxiredoxin
MAVSASATAFDTAAPQFRLKATDGKTYSLDDIAGPRGTVIVFICNHCPYVKAVIGRLVADARTLMADGIGFAAVCSNDAEAYPEDSLDNMKHFARTHDFPFPYLHDEEQAVARAYDAVCTPDFFGFDGDRKLKYRGRLDEGRTAPLPSGARRELVEAMRDIAGGRALAADQVPSIGCSIKWKQQR